MCKSIPKVIGAFMINKCYRYVKYQAKTLSGRNKLKTKSIYTLPQFAVKTKQYYCISCFGKMTLYTTHLKNSFFRHENTICKFYSCHPNESSEHAHAKYYLKWLLENKRVDIPGYTFELKNSINFKCILEKRVKTKKSHIVIDVAIVLNDKVVFGFEIMKTHNTDLLTRPFPTIQLTDTIIDDKSHLEPEITFYI